MRIDGHLVEDEEGSKWPNLESGTSEGMASAGDLFRDKLCRKRSVKDIQIEIVDVAGEILAIVPLDSF